MFVMKPAVQQGTVGAVFQSTKENPLAAAAAFGVKKGLIIAVRIHFLTIKYLTSNFLTGNYNFTQSLLYLTKKNLTLFAWLAVCAVFRVFSCMMMLGL